MLWVSQFFNEKQSIDKNSQVEKKEKKEVQLVGEMWIIEPAQPSLNLHAAALSLKSLSVMEKLMVRA